MGNLTAWCRHLDGEPCNAVARVPLDRVFVALALLLAWTPSATCVAQSERARAVLRWTAPEGCVTEGWLREAVERRLGRAVFVEDDEHADVRLEGEIVRRQSGLAAHLVMRARSGEVLGQRTVNQPTRQCAALREPLALVLALLIDLPLTEIRIALPEPTRPEPPPPRAPPPAVHELRTPDVHVDGTALLAAAPGLLPPASGGLALSLGVTVPPMFPIELGAELFAAPALDAPGVLFIAAIASLTTCPRIELEELALAMCAGTGVGVVHAAPQGLALMRDATTAWLDARVLLRLDVELSPAVALRVDAGVVVPITRHRFLYANAAGDAVLLHEPWPVVPLLRIGANVR